MPVWHKLSGMQISPPGQHPSEASFELPLAMLSACHGRIQQQCQTLQRLLPHLAQHGPDAAARDAAAAVLRYFDSAAVHHHADEECDLFPALIESMAGSDAHCLRELTTRLTREHRELESLWQPLRAVLQRVVDGQAAELDQGKVQTWIDHCTRHIECEESELLPMAARLIGATELDRVGRAMRERRGIDAVI